VRGEIERHGLDLDPTAIRTEKMPIFSKYCEDGSIGLFDEAAEIVSLLARLGKTLAIASGTPAGDIRAVLRNAGFEDTFKVILGSDTVPKIKPAPDIFLKTLSRIELRGEECVVFEDAEKGMFASIEAGIPVVVIRTPQTKRFDFSRADLTLDSHAETLDLVRRAVED
jgi:beta-phosphoglucomutase-like phosphatase (HAD superfamily)